MRYDQIENRQPDEFEPLTGVKVPIFAQMLEAVQEQTRVFGRPCKLALCDCKLALCDQLLLTLMYWREYRSMAAIAVTYGVSEPTVHRTIGKIEAALLASGRFSLPGKKALREPELAVQVVVVDATEVPTPRPKKTTAALQRQKETAHPQSASPRQEKR